MLQLLREGIGSRLLGGSIPLQAVALASSVSTTRLWHSSYSQIIASQ